MQLNIYKVIVKIPGYMKISNEYNHKNDTIKYFKIQIK